jgi:mono/diheme cytochrome c family protein
MRFLAAIAAVCALLVVAACGSQGEISATPETVVGSVPQSTTEQVEVPEGDAAAGADVFASAGCGSCHVLAEAGTTGTVGPNLDDVQPSAEAAYEQILNGGGGMPPYEGQLDEQQIADVTAYVVQATSG